jgi:hypothetical protein
MNRESSSPKAGATSRRPGDDGLCPALAPPTAGCRPLSAATVCRPWPRGSTARCPSACICGAPPRLRHDSGTGRPAGASRAAREYLPQPAGLQLFRAARVRQHSGLQAVAREDARRWRHRLTGRQPPARPESGRSPQPPPLDWPAAAVASSAAPVACGPAITVTTDRRCGSRCAGLQRWQHVLFPDRYRLGELRAALDHILRRRQVVDERQSCQQHDLMASPAVAMRRSSWRLRSAACSTPAVPLNTVAAVARQRHHQVGLGARNATAMRDGGRVMALNRHLHGIVVERRRALRRLPAIGTD